MTAIAEIIAENLEAIRGRIQAACERANRPPDEVQLVAVTKYAELDWVKALIDLGQLHLGESRPQQLSERCNQLPDSITWHMIGHLQRNKVRPVLETGAIIHSVDSARLLDRINRLAEELGITAKIFIEVNISREEAKHGFPPDQVCSTLPLLGECSHVRALGLMGMAPYADDPEKARHYFRELCEIQQSMNASLSFEQHLSSLSMGMSDDFEVAIEEGATHIRVGSALFEGLS